MVSWSNLEKLCSCSRTWMVSALACGNKWIQVGTYTYDHLWLSVDDYDFSTHLSFQVHSIELIFDVD